MLRGVPGKQNSNATLTENELGPGSAAAARHHAATLTAADESANERCRDSLIAFEAKRDKSRDRFSAWLALA